MFNLEDQALFLELISPISEAKIGNGLIDIAYSESKKKLADSMGLRNDKSIDNLRLIPSKDQIILFKSVEHFNKFADLNNYSNLLVIDGAKRYSFIDDKTYINFVEAKEFFLFTNVKCYLEFIQYLKGLVSPDVKEFHFIDSYDFDFRRITMINFSEKGRLNITYPLGIPDFKTSKDYKAGFEIFKSCFLSENKSLPKFLKTEIIKTGQTFDENVRLKNIFESLFQIVEKANINFDVYLNEVSIEKLKKDYDELKTKYFKELSESLGKITQKVIALPIGVSASLIAIDRVSDSPQFLFLLLAVIISTSGILSILINATLKDLTYLKKIFLLDYRVLSENKFFKKYSKELELFSEIKDSFFNKVYFYFNLSRALYFAMNIANIFLALFIFRALNANDGVIAILIIIFSTTILYFLIWKMEKYGS